MQLPLYKTDDLQMTLLQTKWKSILDPTLAVAMLSGLSTGQVSLAIGTNRINHLLGRKQQGWFTTDITGAANYYRSADFNSTYLQLTSDASVNLTIWVY